MSNILSGTDVSDSRYLFEYRHGGSEHGIEIFAKSPQEAKEKMNALAFARYKGEVVASLQVPSAGPIGRIIRRILGI